MATMPPPYNQRDAARAQRDAYKAQRDYWRMQRRPSIVRPILLILIGVIALLIETGHLNGYAFWEWYSRWWPLLLIVIGVLSLGEWWLERDRPYGARRGIGGIVFLVLLLAFIGSSSHFGYWHADRGRSSNWAPFFFSDNDHDDNLGWHIFGQQHDASVQLDQAVPAGASLRINNPYGDVTISASSDDNIHVTAHDVVYASSDKDAAAKLRRVAPRLNVSGSQITLESPSIRAAHCDVTIQIPGSASLDINAAHGDVTVDGTKNSVTVSSGHGDVKLDNIAGSVRAHMTKGDFSATSVTGEVAVDGRMDDVSLASIKSHVSLNGDFFGDMHLQQITGPLNVHSSRTDINIAAIPGALTLDSGDLQFKNVQGPLRISTRSKDIAGSSIKGPAHIDDSNGDITITVLAPITDVDVHNSNGSIDLSLPPDAKFNLTASTKDGDLSTDFNTPESGNDDNHSINSAVNGGGPSITAVSEHGDIHIRKAGNNPDDDDITPPKAPKPPKPPKSARHLHAGDDEDVSPTVQ